MPYVFDAYGTLFDFNAAVARHRAAAGPDADRFAEVWRIKQIEYTWTHTLAGRYVEFWTLTQRALDYCFERFPSVDRSLRPALLDAYLKLDAYPDALKVAAGAACARRRDRDPDQRLAGDGDVGGGGGRPQGRARCGAFGRCREDVQAAPGGLCAGHGALRLQAGRRGVRLLEPLGCDGRDRVRLSHRLGEPRQGARRISGLPAGRGGRQPDRRAVGADSSPSISGSRPCRRRAGPRPTRSRISSSRRA